MTKILKCPKCNEYTLKLKCPKCKIKTKNPKPPKYSPEDRYGKWRRIQKKKMEGEDE